ncbi:hypothetical protein [Leuconostoc gelidum]|uniref:hypothetical protein n=1 Tax=Leuconostoc gelidum TaxID=1244 RepID=UPI001C7DCBCC|nr:hypothetical protein [Leuconostoc gelidum]MBZ6009759.1 hypothetical protein [Leuconostoc gelidum subsp. aenigmaticum]
MALSEALRQSVFSFYPNYEEGISVTAEVADNAKKCYLGYHDFFTANSTMRHFSTFFDLDSSLERFAKHAKELVDNKSYDSMAILGDYLELNDCFQAVKKYF